MWPNYLHDNSMLCGTGRALACPRSTTEDMENMKANRRGFTVTELLTIVAVLGIVAAIALPKTGKIFEGMSVRSARHEVASHLAMARALAIQNGATTTFERSGNSIRVTLDVPGSPTKDVMAWKNLSDEYGVRLDGVAIVRYNARGFAYGLTDNPSVIRMYRGESRDSVCMMGRGQVMSSGCTL